ncbi:hypothetical protein EDC04DRAFT_3097270 [Pisolithus marmoratus]|nr:hypothetical protein EDC04DRAFT_3097270 [Pisolithus marmoratus]
MRQVFVSGCTAPPPTMYFINRGIVQQTTHGLPNVKAVLEASGSGVGCVVKTMVFLKNMNDFVTVNGIHAAFVGDHRLTRSAVEAVRLPKDILLFGIECIASMDVGDPQNSSLSGFRSENQYLHEAECSRTVRAELGDGKNYGGARWISTGGLKTTRLVMGKGRLCPLWTSSLAQYCRSQWSP